ncbi:MAG: protein YgfX [Pseudomonadota bacterium]|nr:protein YgfX [Pseudomonadota bacterium]
MWIPDLRLRPSAPFTALIVLLHFAAAVAVWILPAVFWPLLPLVVLAGFVNVAKYGLLLLKTSVVRVWMTEAGWFIAYRDQRQAGPLTLSPETHLGSYAIRLSFISGRGRRHILVTPDMIGFHRFRKLQVFLRWAPNKQQAVVSPQ